MNLNLNDKLALVLGGSQGIGFGIANSLSQEGVSIILGARSADKLDIARKEIEKNGGKVIKTFEVDVSSPSYSDILKSNIIDQNFFPDIVINNSGGPPMGNFLEFDNDVWIESFHLSLLSVVITARLFSPHMKKKQWGRFINITSSNALEPTPEMVLSSTLRSGVSAFTKSTSFELIKSNITINTICPGGVKTDRFNQLVNAAAEKNNVAVEEIIKKSEQGIPIGRLANAGELGNLATYLCSPVSDYITGRTIAIDGGLLKSF